MTDPAGKWKVQQMDAMGNLVRVIEPNPAGGADLIDGLHVQRVGADGGCRCRGRSDTDADVRVYGDGHDVARLTRRTGR